MLLSAWRSQRSLAEAEQAASRLSERSVQGIELASRLETLMHEKSYVSNFLLSGDPAYLADAAPHRHEFEAWIEQMDGFARTDPERARVAQLREAYLSYVAKGDEVIRLEQEGKRSEARGVFFSMKREVESLLGDGQALFAQAAQDMRERQRKTASVVAEARTTTFLLTAIGAMVSLIAGFLLARSAAKPLYKLVLRLGTSGAVDRLQFNGDEIGTVEAHVNALLERVRHQERALLQAEKLSELGQIAAEIAHETLNPLAGVKGMLQALRLAPLPPERLHQELTDMERELSRVEGIVRRLVRYARPLEPHPQQVKLAALLEGALRSARAAPGSQGRTVRLEVADPALEWVLDPALVEQVLVNLVVNACEASGPGAEVWVGFDRNREGLHFWVRDRGCGLPTEEKQRLFRPFFTTKPGGNGLGLAVSRNIVEEHGGQISAESNPGGGAIFQVVLPEGEVPCASPS